MNLDKSNSSLKYPLFLGGLTAAAGLGYLYYHSVNSKTTSDFELSREQVKAILKEFKKDFYPIFKYLTNLSLTIQNDYKKKFNYIPDNIRNNLSTMLIDENPAFKEQVYAMEDKVYSKFGIHNRAGFEAYVLKLAKIDSDVQALVNEIKNEFRKALMGVSVTENINLPDIINPELILQVYKDSLKLVLQRILSFVMDYKERHGEINAYDENFAMQLKDLNLEQMKLKVLEEKGLGNFEDYHPEKIFHFALTKYSKEDQSFKDRLVKMEVFHQTLMQKLFAPNTDIKGLQDELHGIDKLVEVEEFVIKEIKDEWEDIKETNEPNENNDLVIVEEKQDNGEENDVIITEKTPDHTITTHIHNNEVVEQIEEINVHDTPKADEDGFIQGPEDKDSEDEVEENNKPEENTEQVEEQKTEAPEEVEETQQDAHGHNFGKTGEPVIDVVENEDFTIEETELKPVPISEPEIQHEEKVETPKLDLE